MKKLTLLVGLILLLNFSSVSYARRNTGSSLRPAIRTTASVWVITPGYSNTEPDSGETDNFPPDFHNEEPENYYPREGDGSSGNSLPVTQGIPSEQTSGLNSPSISRNNPKAESRAVPQFVQDGALGTSFAKLKQRFERSEKAAVSELEFNGWATAKCYKSGSSWANRPISSVFTFDRRNRREDDEMETVGGLIQNADDREYFQKMSDKALYEFVRNEKHNVEMVKPNLPFEPILHGPTKEIDGDAVLNGLYATRCGPGCQYVKLKFSFRKTIGNSGEEFIIKIDREMRALQDGPIYKETQYCF